MKKLNNKGITTIELIISFVLIIMVASSLFSTITAYNEKRLVEGYKAEILTYKKENKTALRRMNGRKAIEAQDNMGLELR